MKKIRSIIAKEVWIFSEVFDLPLGKYAPTIFGWMINSKGKKYE